MEAGDWEVRGLFGNEYALDHALDEIKKMRKPPGLEKLDRRNLQVVVWKNDAETKKLVRNIITIAHGFIESDAPLGTYEQKKKELKAKKLKLEAEKRKRKAKRAQQH
ncbi:MAG: hypothetical protein OK455_00490 [Thaumarchaeota archaeon]|nr:hypothetical protein [Nitrososphaerota archaeon]